MTAGLIAANTQHTGDPKRDNRGYAEPYTSEQVDSLLSEDWLREMVAEIRAGKEELKDKLPYICPHYSRFNNNHRAQSDIIPEAFTYMTCVDVDEKALVEKALEKALELNSEEGGDWEGMVLRIDYSARKKLHVWLRMPVGKTIAETQTMYCDDSEIPYDESCITPERYIYLTGIGEEVYRSDQWLKPLSEAELEERREAFLNRGLDADGRPLAKGKAVKSPAVDAGSADVGAIEPIEANERTRFIFDECMKEAGLEWRNLNIIGKRHNSLKSILSVGATQLLEKPELLGVLKEKMPDNWQDHNIQKLVNDFYENYTDENRKMTVFERRVYSQALRFEDSQGSTQASESDGQLPTFGENTKTVAPGMDAPLTVIYSSTVPPMMPEQQPKLIRLLLRNTPLIYKPTVAHAVFPPLGVHLHNVQFPYTDNVLHEATLMNVAMAGTGGGKGCVDEPINRIMADIRGRDAENERRLREFNDANNRKGANKDKLERPDDLVIQEIQADVTHAGFVQRLDEAQKRFLYFKLNEIEMFDQLKSKPGQQFVIICQAFDPGNRYGQTRAGSQSVNATVSIRFNWNSCGTIGAVQAYFAKVLTKGPISRISKSKDQTMSMLNQWVHREYIVRVTELSFKKLKYKTNESRSN